MDQYIYGLIDPRTAGLRYVGRTYRPPRRLRDHLREAASGRRLHRCNWIRQLASAGLEPEWLVIEVTTSELVEDAERFWIAYFKAIGADLTNQTDGGEGTLGRSHSPETRAKIGLKSRGRVHSAETRAKMGATRRSQVISAEHRAKISAKNGNRSAESRDKTSAANRGRYVSPETREKLRLTSTGRAVSPETRAKLAAALARRNREWADRPRVPAGEGLTR